MRESCSLGRDRWEERELRKGEGGREEEKEGGKGGTASFIGPNISKQLKSPRAIPLERKETEGQGRRMNFSCSLVHVDTVQAHTQGCSMSLNEPTCSTNMVSSHRPVCELCI